MILYTTHCPRCRVLENALSSKGLSYETCEDVQKMLDLGLTEAPALDVDGKVLNYSEAMKYIMEEM